MINARELLREEAEYPGDEHVDDPRWSWTHAIEIEASVSEVWPWIIQMGQDKAGFYSYQWLENAAGCHMHNADRIHPEWQAAQVGDALRLHPKISMRIATIEAGRFLLAVEGPQAPGHALPAVRASWIFFLEPLGPSRCRFVSRYRITYPNGLRNRLAFGPWPLEALSFVMDRAMLRGVKRRAEFRHRIDPARSSHSAPA